MESEYIRTWNWKQKKRNDQLFQTKHLILSVFLAPHYVRDTISYIHTPIVYSRIQMFCFKCK